MKFRILFLCISSLICLSTVLGQDEQLQHVYENMEEPPSPEDYSIHDPSRIVRRRGYELVAVTGKAQEDGYNCGLETWYRAKDSKRWLPGQCLLRKKPDWVMEEIDNQDGAYWAPELINYRTMYYSVADFSGESTITCVGLARAKGSFPNKLVWEDQGYPVSCVNRDDWDFEVSAIDPSFLKDREGKSYLITGGGLIHGTEVDSKAYMPLSGDWFGEDADDWKQLARGPHLDDTNDWVEASFAYRHGKWYYLFVNWGSCCRGTESTYNIRVGRSENPLGPYFDKKGCDMIEGCGTLILDDYRDMIGPGHTGIRRVSSKRFIISFHYYDKKRNGNPWIAERELRWVNGWPKVGKVLNTFN